MSLDVSLITKEPVKKRGTGVMVRDEGKTKELVTLDEVKRYFPDADLGHINEYEYETTEVYHGNITHNLGKMADVAGIYDVLWRPDEIGITTGAELIEPLREGLHKLKMDPEKYKEYNPDNGWGTYEGLVNFVTSYLDTCYEYPDAKIDACR